MYVYGFWFYNELRDQVGTRPAKQRGDRADSYIELTVPNGTIYTVKTSSWRLELFKNNPKCVSCHRVGELWILEGHHPKEAPHLNLYAVGEPDEEWKKISVNGLVLMTKDHIYPKSLGGKNDITNYQTMCTICNQKKGALVPSKKLVHNIIIQ